MLLALLLLSWLLIQTEPVQNWLVKKVTTRLSNDLNTEVSIKHVSFSLFNRMNLEGTVIKDQQKDTLLYSSHVKVRLTDWFFLKDELVLKYIGLEDTFIKIHRKDSVWNYQFIVDYFSPSKPSSGKSNLKFDLKKLDFKKVIFVKDDLWVGQRMEVKLGNFQLDAENFDLDKNKITIKEIDLVDPSFSLTDFDGFRPKKKKVRRIKDSTELYFNPGLIELVVKKINVKNGTFINDKVTARAPYPYFDGLHLRFEKINGSLTNISFLKDTIKANIELSGKERSGFELKKLKADFTLTPEIMEFANLDLVTPKSRLKNYYAMKFEDFNQDFNDYIHVINMKAKFVGSEIHSDDIAFFAPELKGMNKKISIGGEVNGTVDELVGKNVFIRAGPNTTLVGDITVKGLPDIKTTFFSLKNGLLQTTYRDAVTFIPDIAKVEVPSLSSLGKVQFIGNFNGTINDFKTEGNFRTELGGFTANVSMQLPEKGIPKYSGKLVTKQFDVGRFLVIPGMGNVTFDGSINGIGLRLDNLKTSVTGNIQQLAYQKYDYKNIAVEGTFQKKQFEGTVKIDDTNLNFFTTVIMDFRTSEPVFNVLGDLASSNFNNLKLTDKHLELSGLFDLNFSGKNIDQFLGSVKVYNANILQDGLKLNFDSLSLQSNYEAGKRSLTLNSNEFDAKIVGEYNILDLPTSFQVFLHKYYPAYINEPKKNPKDQRFTFDLTTRNFDGYTQLLDKRLSGFSNSSVSGILNTVDTVFEVKATVPAFAYQNYQFNDINFTGKGNLDNVKLEGELGNIFLSDGTNFPNTKISINSRKDESEVSIQSKASNTLNELNLNATVQTFYDGVNIKFNPSDFVINDKRWKLDKEGEIVIRKRFVSADNVRFSSGDQVIEVATVLDHEFDKNNLVIKLTDLNLGDFSPLITKDPRLEGIVSGDVELKDFFGEFGVVTKLKVQQFRLDNDSIGVVVLKGNYNNKSGLIKFDVESDNDLYNFLGSGAYNLKDSTGLPLTTNLVLNRTKINILNRFLGSVFTDVDGLASGNLQINGDINKPELLGDVKLYNGSLTVNFTKVRYEIDSARILLQDGVIDFGKFTLKDKFGNTGSVRGKIFQKRLQNIRYDFTINTDRMLLIDTKANDNDQFYGNAIGKATLTLNGPQDNLHMGIYGEPVDSSHIFIPTSDTRESGDADFIVWKQYGEEMKQIGGGNSTNIIVDLELVANPLAKIDVILDEITGDIIKAVGNGRLRIHAGTTESLTINGRYEIQKGSYDFSFQSFIKKPFILQEDANSFIEWNGDPYNARLQVKALYVADNVRLGDLVGNQIQGAVQGYQGEVYIVANISGKLQKPDIDFQLDFPPQSGVRNNETFNKFLTKLENDKNEMLKQVTYLLVFGTFAPYGEGRDLANNFTTLGYNTISELVSNQVKTLVSNLLYQITGDRSLQFDVSASVYNSSSLFNGNVSATNAIDRTRVKLKLGKSLFNNKVIITVGGDLDLRTGSSSVTSQQLGNLQWLPDLTVEIVLTKDRKLRAIVFSRNNFDITTNAVGRVSRQGASISYRRDFERLFEQKPKEMPEVKRQSN